MSATWSRGLELHAFHGLGIDELGHCPLVNPSSSACLFLESPEGVGISLMPFQVKNSLVLEARPIGPETPTFISVIIIANGFLSPKK